MKPIVKSRQRSIRSLLIMSALLVLGYAASQARQTTFEGQPDAHRTRAGTAGHLHWLGRSFRLCGRIRSGLPGRKGGRSSHAR